MDCCHSSKGIPAGLLIVIIAALSFAAYTILEGNQIVSQNNTAQSNQINTNNPSSGNLSAGSSELLTVSNVREFSLGFDWNTGNYNPQEIRVRKGDKVKIIGDTNTLAGCMSTLVINGMGIRKRFSEGDNVLEFIANTPGRYRLTCGMGMGNGLLIVEDENGNVPNNVISNSATSGYTGGCGCGCRAR